MRRSYSWNSVNNSVRIKFWAGDLLRPKLTLVTVFGDSGSWIVDQVSGNLLGHIVAGNPGSNLAYVAPAKAVFADIESTLGCKVNVAEEWNLEQPGDELSIPQKSITGSKTISIGIRHLMASESGHECFIDEDGIDYEVITADISVHLGNNAEARYGNYKVSQPFFTILKELGLIAECRVECRSRTKLWLLHTGSPEAH